MVKTVWEKRPRGTVTTPAGFSASGLHCGIKRNKSKYDLSLIYSKSPCVAAGTFTTNQVKAWCVHYSMKSVKSSLKHHGVLVTSGNANCINGLKGKKSLEECMRETEAVLKAGPGEILAAQTGLIGVPFPTQRVVRSLPKLVKKLSGKPGGGRAAARGILTTDRSLKQVALSVPVHGKKVTIGAISKGSGMVHPNMATMLMFITTDCAITRPLLRRALRHAVDNTFNRISIDNDTSTNDMAFVLANGEAGNPVLKKVDRDYRRFRDTLEEVCRIMAYEMVRDGEGVTHVCTLNVKGARTSSLAEKAARQVANSMLFKTMLAGADPNWGRIAAAIGASGIAFRPEDFHVSFGGIPTVVHGKVRALNLPKARRVLEKKEYTIEVVIGKGRGQAQFVTSDLTAKYVSINAAYS